MITELLAMNGNLFNLLKPIITKLLAKNGTIVFYKLFTLCGKYYKRMPTLLYFKTLKTILEKSNHILNHLKFYFLNFYEFYGITQCLTVFR